MSEMKERRVALNRDFFASIKNLKDEDKQHFAVFMSLFRLGQPADIRTLKAASDYETVKVPFCDDLIIIMKHVGQTFLFLKAGSAADMHDWAHNYRCEINEKSGLVQIFGVIPDMSISLNEPTPAPEEPKEEVTYAYADIDDETLLSLGLPKERLESVRGVVTVDDLVALQDALPDRVYEALTWLIQGEPLADVLSAYRIKEDKPVGHVVNDDVKLDAGDFRIIETDEDLRDIMDRPLDEWRVFLHPTQRRLVENNWRGAVRVQGGAGTGKTVVAIHRAAHLVRLPDWQPDDELLFTTFSRNLAIDLKGQLATLLTREERRSIEVVNIDRWIGSYLQKMGFKKTIVYPGSQAYKDRWATALDAKDLSLDFADTFYWDEWTQVVLPQNCQTQDDYLFADRRGRGRALTRGERRKMWPVFEAMRLELLTYDQITAEEAALQALELVKKNSPKGLYRAVIVDEAQDFGPEVLRLLRALTPDISGQDDAPQGDIFAVGDPRQRIYDRMTTFKACGINIVGRSAKLRVNYRTTEEIRRIAMTVTDDAHTDAAQEAKCGYVSLRHGMVPVTYAAASREEEGDWIVQQIRQLIQGQSAYSESEICVTARGKHQLQAIKESLEDAGIKTREIRRNTADDATLPGVRLATMHRIKGLEYKVIFVAALDEGIVPMAYRGEPDPVIEEQHHRREAALFHVACTRAVDALFLSCNTKPGEFLKPLLG